MYNYIGILSHSVSTPYQFPHLTGCLSDVPQETTKLAAAKI